MVTSFCEYILIPTLCLLITLSHRHNKLTRTDKAMRSCALKSLSSIFYQDEDDDRLASPPPPVAAPPEPSNIALDQYQKAPVFTKGDRGPNLNRRASRRQLGQGYDNADFEWDIPKFEPAPPPPPPPPPSPPPPPPSPPPGPPSCGPTPLPETPPPRDEFEPTNYEKEVEAEKYDKEVCINH